MPKLLVLAICLMLPALAFAQEPVRKNERYCLEERAGWRVTQPLLCRFETLEQCLASRNGPSDRCILNPYLQRR